MTERRTVMVERFKVDESRLRERYSDACEDLPFYTERAKEDATNLSLMASTAMDVAICGSIVDSESEKIEMAMQLAGQAYAAHFLTSTAISLPIEVEVGQGGPVTFQTRPDLSAVRVSEWLRGFFINVICRNHRGVESMCKIPTDQLRAVSKGAPEYRFLWIDAVKSFWANETQTNEKILAALEATDPHRGDIQEIDWTLNIDVPLLQLLFYVNDRDPEFAENLPRAIQLHKKFWSSSKALRDNWDGFIAIELSALMALAYERNMDLGVESDFVPLKFVRGKGGHA